MYALYTECVAIADDEKQALRFCELAAPGCIVDIFVQSKPHPNLFVVDIIVYDPMLTL